MVEMFGLKKPLPIEMVERAISMIASSRGRSALGCNPSFGDGRATWPSPPTG